MGRVIYLNPAGDGAGAGRCWQWGPTSQTPALPSPALTNPTGSDRNPTLRRCSDANFLMLKGVKKSAFGEALLLYLLPLSNLM